MLAVTRSGVRWSVAEPSRVSLTSPTGNLASDFLTFNFTILEEENKLPKDVFRQCTNEEGFNSFFNDHYKQWVKQMLRAELEIGRDYALRFYPEIILSN